MARSHGHWNMSRKTFLPEDAGGCRLWNERRVLSRWEAWVYLINAAAWTGHEVIVGGSVVPIERGETRPLAIRYLMRAWRWGSKKRVVTFLNLLTEDGKIGYGKRTPDGYTYRIVNYEHYQNSGDTEGDASGTVGGDSRGTQAGTKENKGKKGKKGKLSDDTVDPHFDRAWSRYPPRSGGNPRKQAREAWNARRREGVSVEDLSNGLDRYIAYVEATGKVGTEYVMQARTFFGPAHRYAETWDAPSGTGKARPQHFEYAKHATKEWKEPESA